MLTLFATPKAFAGFPAIIQRNAIGSWRNLEPRCEILLFGDEEGTGTVAAEFDARHVPDVETTEYGTPLLSDMFTRSQEMASNDTLCFLNADIILGNDFARAVDRVPWSKFFMAGQRWDLDVDSPIDFNDPEWEGQLHRRVSAEGIIHHPGWIDYFVFTRGIWGNIPDFAVGRPCYDNWLIWRARSSRIPVIDATPSVTAIHQNHGATPPSRKKSPEGRKNLELTGGKSHQFTLRQSNWMMTQGGVLPAVTRRYLRPRWEAIPVLYPGVAALHGRLDPLVRAIMAPMIGN